MSRTITCPGCGLSLPSGEEQLHERYNASYACSQLYEELTAYTLSLQDADFIHQEALDTYAAQHAGANAKPIAITFALAGLYLVFEHHYTGKKVQKAHTLMAKTTKTWPAWKPPLAKASLTVFDVLNAAEEARPALLRAWSKAVWEIWQPEHIKIAALVYERIQV